MVTDWVVKIPNPGCFLYLLVLLFPELFDQFFGVIGFCHKNTGHYRFLFCYNSVAVYNMLYVFYGIGKTKFQQKMCSGLVDTG